MPILEAQLKVELHLQSLVTHPGMIISIRRPGSCFWDITWPCQFQPDPSALHAAYQIELSSSARIAHHLFAWWPGYMGLIFYSFFSGFPILIQAYLGIAIQKRLPMVTSFTDFVQKVGILVWRLAGSCQATTRSAYA